MNLAVSSFYPKSNGPIGFNNKRRLFSTQHLNHNPLKNNALTLRWLFSPNSPYF